ncbi:MAG: glycosyltransferase family 2 protein [Prevotellaceae bacterium]|jgi:GT2 family glycosyltransferase|nr:glycosyltransferase family 2 protein [Prevotellaceae bacterium]
MMMDKQSVSVVIPNFNGSELLRSYLPAVYDALKSSIYVSDFEIIVVDDASKDDSVQFISDNFPEIILLKNAENSGFSKTINKGIFVAKMELILLLNSDMALQKDIFDYLIPPFSLDTELFGVAPTILNQAGDKVLEAQKLPDFSKNKISYLDNFNQTKTANSLYLCGGCALVNRDKLLKINGFSEIYSPFYFEDYDLSVRAWLNGWKCLYVPEARVLHCHSVTIKTYFDKEKVEKIFIRNRLLLNYLYLNNFDCFLFSLKNYGKYILGGIFSSKSKRKFNVSFKMYQKIMGRKTMRKEMQAKENLNEVLKKYFK